MSAASIDNPVQHGQALWRLRPRRRCKGSFHIQRGDVTEVNWHYFKVTPEPAAWCHTCWHRAEWLDAREMSTVWFRNLPQAVDRLAVLQGLEIHWRLLAMGDQGAKRPCQWARFFRSPQPHPRSIAAAFRWLAGFGLAARSGGRRGRWRISLTPTP